MQLRGGLAKAGNALTITPRVRRGRRVIASTELPHSRRRRHSHKTRGRKPEFLKIRFISQQRNHRVKSLNLSLKPIHLRFFLM